MGEVSEPYFQPENWQLEGDVDPERHVWVKNSP